MIEGLAPLPVQAQKEKQQAGGPGKGGAKKSDGGVRFTHPEIVTQRKIQGPISLHSKS